jgi:hypothetical protein
MSFYLRKAFKVGPLRLNLSKGGLGLSAGVTGARIGLSPRGAYVHGGRHGIYYRKYLKKGKSTPTGSRPVTKSVNPKSVPYQPNDAEVLKTWETSDTRYLMIDTNAVFTSTFIETENTYQSPDLFLPDPTSYKTPTKWILITSTVAFFFTLFYATVYAGIPFFLMGCGAFGYRIWNDRAYEQAEKSLTDIVILTEQLQSFPDSAMAMINRLPERWRQWLTIKTMIVLSELAMRHHDIDMKNLFHALDSRLQINPVITATIRGSIVSLIIDEMLSDHMLDDNEELAIQRLLEQVVMDDSIKTKELNRTNFYSTLKKSLESPIKSIEVDVPLVRGEYAVYDEPKARLLNERVQKRYQRDRTQYVELGFDIELEGRLIVTDRRILLVHGGTREYRINQIMDVTSDPAGGIVELSIAGRQSPVILSSPNLLELTGMIQKVVAQAIQSTS